jgi:hypothetical protein
VDTARRSSGPPEEMSARLGRVIPLLQAEAKHFWDPGLSDWYVQSLLWHPDDTEKVCKPAYLHAELWRNEETSEELWALVALREGWSPPDGAIERAVWLRVTAPGTADDVDLEAPGDEFEV